MTSSIDIVRLNVSDKSTLKREKFVGDGTRTNFALEKQNILASPAARVFLANVYQTSGYTLDPVTGVLIFSIAPVAGLSIDVDYFFGVYSDAEIQTFLDQTLGNTDMASARLLLSWSASQARLAMRETLSGGAGMGQTTRDTSVVAKELREAAKTFMDIADSAATAGDGYQVDGVTEPIWNDFSMREALEQDIIRDWP